MLQKTGAVIDVIITYCAQTHCCRFPHDTGWTAVDPKAVVPSYPPLQHP